MLLIIAYIMNNERLNLSMVRNENSFSQYYTGSLINLNSLYMLEGEKDISDSKKNELKYAGGFLVNGASLVATWIIIAFIPDPRTYAKETYFVYFTFRFLTDFILVPSTICDIGYLFGNKGSSYSKTVCGVLIGEILSFGMKVLTPEEIKPYIFYVSLLILPPLGGVIGSNL